MSVLWLLVLTSVELVVSLVVLCFLVLLVGSLVPLAVSFVVLLLGWAPVGLVVSLAVLLLGWAPVGPDGLGVVAGGAAAGVSVKIGFARGPHRDALGNALFAVGGPSPPCRRRADWQRDLAGYVS